MTSLVYSTGTVSVSNASAVVTGTGTAWALALVTGGMFSFAGMSVPILSVESDTSLTLAYAWPGTTASGAYAIARETSEAVRAAWINDRLARLMTKPWGTGVVPDGRGTLAERDALNPMPTDKYCWLREEPGFDPTLYFKTPSGWIGPYSLVGEQGPPGVGEGGYGLPAGGTTGQVPVKSSGVDGAVAWGTIDQASVDTQSTLATTRGDAAYAILATDRAVLLTAALTAGRIWSLPAASAYKAGRRLVVRDAVGGVSSTNTLTIQRAGTDTIDGATTLVLDTPWEGAELVSNGADAWSVMAVSAGNTKARRRRSLGLDDTTAAPTVGDAFKWNGTLWVPAKSREALTANRTYFVRTDGSNSNDGRTNTAGGAFLTKQKAYETLLTLDLNGFDVTVAVADGSYTAGILISKNWVGGTVIFSGSTSAIVSIAGNHAILTTVPLSNVLSISGLKLQTSGAGDCIRNSAGGKVTFSGTEFGSCAAAQINADAVGALVECTGNYSISGGAVNHAQARYGGMFRCTARTVTLTGTPAFSGAFVRADQIGNALVNGNTYSGSATGKRYDAVLNGVIQTGGAGASALPGDVAGTTATGGQYQ
ncbi:hypothetical protein EDC40_103636 [Aminobacter aminovorans]|uniref:Uncharacterized protein n=1 Tax=Aminobacter aminovorans TaxID=83263 RepID=A0A380WKN7_AMIAI|nr:hypothetical protein [Aminobacter aminovorans]TCS28168.1 hypothetical protein EDC40_103636 [Aminobacter aminovorans]SUU89420.1 Uncharacterised protein [Aminobacter aminovorans]